MANIFNPQRFFEKTAYYASQGRGLFTLSRIPFLETPGVLPAQSLGWKTHKDTVKELLGRGIVAKSVSSPSSTLATFEEFSYIGPTRKHPHTQIFGPISVEFYLMGNQPQEAQALYDTFLFWHEYISGPRFAKNEASKGIRSDSTFYANEYYDNYVAEAEFKVFDAQDSQTPIIHNKYFEIYPITVGGIQTSWESQDTPLTLSVEFEFYYMQSQLGLK